jgi:hypothetical protein
MFGEEAKDKDLFALAFKTFYLGFLICSSKFDLMKDLGA